MSIEQFAKNAHLRDGSMVHLRPIRPDDKQHLQAAFRRLSKTSKYFRFLSNKQELTEQELDFLTEIDLDHHVAIVAEVNDENGYRGVGIGRYVELKEQHEGRAAEIAFTIDDAHQNMGLGTLLFEQLVGIAQQAGIVKLEAYVFNRNKRMLDILKRSGFDLHKHIDSGIIHIEFEITDTAFNRYFAV